MNRYPRLSPSLLIGLSFSILYLCPSDAHAQADLTAAQWRADVEYLAERLPVMHVEPFHTVTREQFGQAVQALYDRIPALDDHEVVVELARLVTMIGDGHTRLWLTPNAVNGFRRYPIMLYQFKDALHVIAIDAQHAEAVGGRLVRIGKVDVDEAYARVREITHRDNEMTVVSIAPRYLVVPEVLHALGIIDDMAQATYVVENDAGQRIAATFSPVADSLLPDLGNRPMDPPIEKAGIPMVRARDAAVDPIPLWLSDPDNWYWFTYLDDSNTLFVQLNAIANKREESMATFFERVFEVVDTQPVERFVLDLRLNGGGNNLLNQPVIHGIIKRDKINQQGRLFTLISRHTFSAASHLVSKLEMHTNTLFVGEPTGGSPNHYGDAPRMVLPHSKLRPSASTMFWQNTRPYPFEDRSWTPPHLAAPLTIEAYRTNRDPALEAVLSYEPQPSLRTQMLEAIEQGSIERAIEIYHAYKADPVHAYASTEGTLNGLGYRLLHDEKYQEAITIFTLNVEAYPTSDNVYDSLGEAYMRSGNTKRAIENYRKALELNPRKWSAVMALQRLEEE